MLAVFSLALASISLIFSIFAVRYAYLYSAASVSVRQLSKLEAEMTEQADSLSSLHKMLKTLRSRIGMRELRSRRNGATEEPTEDLSTESGRTAARTRLESELASTGKLNARYHLGKH